MNGLRPINRIPMNRSKITPHHLSPCKLPVGKDYQIIEIDLPPKKLAI